MGSRAEETTVDAKTVCKTDCGHTILREFVSSLEIQGVLLKLQLGFARWIMARN